MKHTLLITALLLSSATAAICQTATAVPANVRAENTLDRLIDFDGIRSNDIMYGIPLDPRKTVRGDTYINTIWEKSTLLLSDDKLIEGYYVRYDIHAKELEIKTTFGVKVIEARRVKSFVSVDSITKAPRYFINSLRFKDEKGNVTEGFFEVLSDGKLPLLKKVYLEIVKANYRPEFGVGSREDKILKKVKYYYMKDQNVFEIPRNAKKIGAVFGARAEEMQQFIKNNNLSLKEDAHLKALFNEYNKAEKL